MDIMYDVFMQQMPTPESREKVIELLEVPLGKTLEQTDKYKSDRAAILNSMLGR